MELTPGRGGQLGRSAGTAIQLVAKEGTYATLRLPSGEMRMVLVDCRATIGVLGNPEHELVSWARQAARATRACARRRAAWR